MRGIQNVIRLTIRYRCAISAQKSHAMHCIIYHDPADWLQPSWSLGPRFALVKDRSHSDMDLKLGFLAGAKVFKRLLLWAESKEEYRWKESMLIWDVGY